MFDVPNLGMRQGWECPVCHVGVANWCAVCPECVERKKETISSDTPSVTINPIVETDTGTSTITAQSVIYEDIHIKKAIEKDKK